uniref:NADH dehydrogenase ubiquinone iron-sulfur protein 6 n=1 Tax=Rhizophora mucronata TaxID=61149 RepID=A0A2P2KAL5_RHIMU
MDAGSPLLGFAIVLCGFFNVFIIYLKNLLGFLAFSNFLDLKVQSVRLR